MRTACLLLGIAISPHLAGAHDFWLDPGTNRQAAGQSVRVAVCGGHYFPSSAIVLQDRLIQSCVVRGPAGSEQMLSSVVSGKERQGSFVPEREGVYLLSLTVQKPQLPAPEYWARAIVVTAGATSGAERCASGRGLEIVPLSGLETARPGGLLELEARRDGAAVAGKLQVLSERGGTDWIEGAPGKPARFKVKHPGRHLALLTEGSQSCSLFFVIASL
jgi:hypothetical protein